MNESQPHHGEFTALGTELAARIAQAGFGGAQVSIAQDGDGKLEISIDFDTISGEQAFHAQAGSGFEPPVQLRGRPVVTRTIGETYSERATL
jgi:hypothetical protein